MPRDYAAALPDGLPVPLLYPVLLGVLLVLSATALATGNTVLGVVGVIVLCVLSVSYGAILRPEEML
jgi:hypothetical protein